MSSPCRKRQGERYGACGDDAPPQPVQEAEGFFELNMLRRGPAKKPVPFFCMDEEDKLEFVGVAKSAPLHFPLARKITFTSLLRLSKSNPLALGFDLVLGAALWPVYSLPIN